MTNVQFCLLISEALVPINSRIIRGHFANIMTLNKWEMIAEKRRLQTFSADVLVAVDVVFA